MPAHPDPAHRTATTARALLLVGLAFAVEAIWRGSAAGAMASTTILALGAGLLLAAKRAA